MLINILNKNILFIFICLAILPLQAKDLSETPLSDYLQGCYLSCMEDHEKSLELFQNAQKGIPDSDYLKLKIAKALINIKEVDEAYESLLKITEKNTVYAAEADVILASISLIRRETLTAVSFLNHAMSISQKNSNIYTAVSNLYEQLGMQTEAINVNEQAVKVFPAQHNFLKKLGELCLLDKQYKKAEMILTKALDYYPDDISLLINMTISLDQQNKANEKIPYLKKAISLDPLNDKLIHELIKTYSRLKQWDNALQYCLDYIAMHPDEIHPLTQFAMLTLMAGQPSKAIPVLESAITTFNQSPELHFFLGRLYHDNNQPSEAEKAYLASISLSEEKAVVKYYYALLLNETERTGNARLQLEDAIAEKPMFPKALNLLAYILALDGKELNQALTYVERALKIDPENPAYLDSLGWILHLKGKNAEAMLYIEKALQMDPGNKEIKKHLETVRKGL